jgi:hypothetical protein
VLLSSVYRPDPSADGLWKSFRNDPGQGSDNGPKSDRLEIGMLTGFIPERLPPSFRNADRDDFGIAPTLARNPQRKLWIKRTHPKNRLSQAISH